MGTRRFTRCLGTAAALAVFLAGASSRATLSYTMVDLGTLGGSTSQALDVNTLGQVVGWSHLYGDSMKHAFLWSPNAGMRDLGTLGGLNSRATALNDKGQVVGRADCEASGSVHAFLWSSGVGMIDLGTLGGYQSNARDINEAGQIVGTSDTIAGEQHAFLWEAGTGNMIDLGTLGGGYSEALAINEAGQVIGSSYTTSGEQHAFIWDKSHGLRDLGTLGGTNSFPYAIGEAGQVVGQDSVAAPSYTYESCPPGNPACDNPQLITVYEDIPQAFSWKDGVKSSLGTLPGQMGGTSSAADVNEAGQVVGFASTAIGDHAFLWSAGTGMVDLGTLGGYQSKASRINEHGQVAGNLTPEGDATHAFVWDPEDGMIDLGTLGGSSSNSMDLNDAGQVAGNSTTVDGLSHAFLASPMSNHPPVAVDDTPVVDEDGVLNGSVLGNDTDEDSDPLTAQLVDGPTHGSLAFQSTGTFTYTPAPNYNGTDTFTYTANDGQEDSGIATVSITVTPVNDNPVVSATAASVIVDEGQTASNAGTWRDIDGDTVTLHASTGTVAKNPDGTWSWSLPTADGPWNQTVAITADDGHGGADLATFTLAVNNVAPVLAVSTATPTVQYSDTLPAVTVSVTDVASDLPAITLTPAWSMDGVHFTDGLPAWLAVQPAGATSGGLVWTISGKSNVAAGRYTVRLTASDGRDTSNRDIVFAVQPEDARGTYTGALFVSTSAITSTSATVLLSATIQDITAVDALNDPEAGKIANATVTFVNRDTGEVLAADVPVGLVDPSDPKVGTAAASVTMDIGTEDSRQMTVGLIVGGRYARNSKVDDVVVTVSKPLPNFVTGGGVLVNSGSAGAKAGDMGAKTNFGFNVKNDPRGMGLQGSVNIITRSGGRVYQVKSAAIQSLAVDPVTGRAAVTGPAEVYDITNPRAPFLVDAGASMQLAMTDNGTPGSLDTLGITLWSHDGGLWFSSSWTGTHTAEQPLDGGNLKVH